MQQEYKIMLIGNSAVGKTTYINSLINNSFEKKYIGTLGVELKSVNTFKVLNNEKDIIFNIWDCAGQEKFGAFNSTYCKNCDACIIMFEKYTKKWLNTWISYIKENNNNTPIIFVENKVDKEEDIRKDEKDYIQISVKNSYNLDEPINKLCKILNC